MTDTCPTCPDCGAKDWEAVGGGASPDYEFVVDECRKCGCKVEHKRPLHTDCHAQVAALAGALERTINAATVDEEISARDRACDVIDNLPAEAKEIAAKAQAHDAMKVLLEDTRESQRQRMMSWDCHWGGGFVSPRIRCGMGDFRRPNCTRHYVDAVLERAIAVYRLALAALAEEPE